MKHVWILSLAEVECIKHTNKWYDWNMVANTIGEGVAVSVGVITFYDKMSLVCYLFGYVNNVLLDAI